MYPAVWHKKRLGRVCQGKWTFPWRLLLICPLLVGIIRHLHIQPMSPQCNSYSRDQRVQSTDVDFTSIFKVISLLILLPNYANFSSLFRVIVQGFMATLFIWLLWCSCSCSWHLFVTNSQETVTPLYSVLIPFLSGPGYPLHSTRNCMIFLSLFKKIVGNDINMKKSAILKFKSNSFSQLQSLRNKLFFIS